MHITPVYKIIFKNHIRLINSNTQPLLVGRSKTGRPQKLSDEGALESIFHVLETGSQWRSARTPPGVKWQTVYDRFRKWSSHGVFEKSFHDLVKWYLKVSPRTRGGRKDSICVDTTYVKNVFGRKDQILGRNHTDRGRKATKVSIACDSKGTPLCFRFHPGNRNDIRTLGCLFEEGVRKLKSVKFPSQFKEVFADRGYDSENCRSIVRSHGLEPEIPKRSRRGQGQGHVRRDINRRWRVDEGEKTRYVVEQTFGIFDLFRRLKVRYDGLASTFKSFHFFAAGVLVGKRLTLGPSSLLTRRRFAPMYPSFFPSLPPPPRMVFPTKSQHMPVPAF